MFTEAVMFGFSMLGIACFVYILFDTTSRNWRQFKNQLYTRGYNDHADGLANLRKH